MKMHRLAAVAAALGCASVPAMGHAQASKFALEYRVERKASVKLGLGACVDTAKKASAALGYQPAMENRFPGQLGVFASGPSGGGASLVVYCIAVDQKTAFVVQAIDYMRPNSPQAAKAADRVHAALMAAAG